jgi:hypothetical protein
MTAYGWQNAFGLASSRCEVRGENHPPEADAWGTKDDTLSRQGGHGICKGLATAWVIAFLNQVSESSDVNAFGSYFRNVLQFQGTYIKDFGKHIDSHLVQMIKMKVDTGVHQVKQYETTNLETTQLPGHTWGAYLSVWKHDIAMGYRRPNYYIMEPNFGLFVYGDKANFVNDGRRLIEARRARKHKGQDAKIGVWMYAHTI